MLAQPSLSPQAQTDIARIEEAEIDYLSGLSSEEKKARLARMSYRDFLLNVAKADPGSFHSIKRGPIAGEASASMPFQRSMSGRSASLASKASILSPVRHRTWDTQPRATPTAPLTRSIFLTEMPRSRGSWCAVSSRRVCRPARAPRTWSRHGSTTPVSIIQPRPFASGSAALPCTRASIDHERREALTRLAKYTAPAMLAVLVSVAESRAIITSGIHKEP